MRPLRKTQRSLRLIFLLIPGAFSTHQNGKSCVATRNKVSRRFGRTSKSQTPSCVLCTKLSGLCGKKSAATKLLSTGLQLLSAHLYNGLLLARNIEKVKLEFEKDTNVFIYLRHSQTILYAKDYHLFYNACICHFTCCAKRYICCSRQQLRKNKNRHDRKTGSCHIGE